MLDCTVIDDFPASGAEEWFVVNDGVMGGRSEGGVATEDGRLVFEGRINTDGGGFSSIRRPLEPGAIAGARAIRLEAESDGRAYELIAKSDARHRGRAVSYRAPLEPAPDGTLEASLTGMSATLFGREVQAPPFDPARAEEIGVILADGKDGPFRLAIPKVLACR